MIFLVILVLLLTMLFVLTMSKNLGLSGTKMFVGVVYAFMVPLSVLNFWQICFLESSYEVKSFIWVTLGHMEFDWVFKNDVLSSAMVFIVSLVSCMVNVYSLSYMGSDPHLKSFLLFLSLFSLFMVVLVASSNLVVLFIGWEGVGVCSFLLVGFWCQSAQAVKSAFKAILMNSLGDLGFLAGTILLIKYGGTLGFPNISAITLKGEVCCAVLVFFMLGVAGKSSQFGLHTWLPDAMEGPTPVSALIHAATMVTAGVFLMVSLSVIFSVSQNSLMILLFLGGLTAMFASSVGLVQNDIKKVMAYSTCSQLGYMVFVCGVCGFSLSLFHLVNHACFKALLFLSAGSIIHSLSDEQDVSKGLNLVWTSPITAMCLVAGSLALLGLPFLTGFYSKDLIMEITYSNSFLFCGFMAGLMGALFTSFYSSSLLIWGSFSFSNGNFITKKLSSESSFFLVFPLTMLLSVSMVLGYLSSNFFLLDYSVAVPNSMKMFPLMFSFMGALLAMLMGCFYKTVSMPLVFFLSSAWNMNENFNFFFGSLMLNMSSWLYFKMDSGFLEKLGNTGMGDNMGLMHFFFLMKKSLVMNNFIVFMLFFLVLVVFY